MKKQLLNLVLSVSILLTASAVPAVATCGGGGGGGDGGMGASEKVYTVPWKVVQQADASNADGILVYWFPASQADYEVSDLRNSRPLSLYAKSCFTFNVIQSADSPLFKQFANGAQLPLIAVISAKDGALISKIGGTGSGVTLQSLEDNIAAELKSRENALTAHMNTAQEKLKSGDRDAAITEFKSVVEQQCMFPKRAREAAKELKKLGISTGQIPEPFRLNPLLNTKIEHDLVLGLRAEEAGNFAASKRFYETAHNLDPADPTPLRFLGELYRHHIGDWTKAKETFQQILSMNADPLSRAVALHGIGKMTIHNGEFKKGEQLMEQALSVYPLAMTCRNLAVYWNSEGDRTKCGEYTREALRLDPKDPFNVIFAAVFMAGSGQTEEALKIASKNIEFMPASYNLAAIYAQSGDKEKALELLKRHFFQYERNASVRSKEMMEARVDAVFDFIAQDPRFIALTSGADGMLPPRTPGTMKTVRQ